MRESFTYGSAQGGRRITGAFTRKPTLAPRGKHKGRISIIYYFFLNPINPTLQPAVSADLL
jgi:hypothetical protein